MALASGMVALVSAVLIGIDIVARAVAGRELVSSFELTSFGLAIAFALGLPYSFVSGAHIRIDAIDRLRHWIFGTIAGLSAYLSMAIFAVVLAWFGLETVLETLRSAARSNSTLALPLAVPQALWFAGLALFAVVTVFAFLRAVAWALSDRNADFFALTRADAKADTIVVDGLDP